MISHVLPTYNRADIAFERGEGAWAIATDGTRYLDLGAGIAVNVLGHANPDLVAALIAQARALRSIMLRHPPSHLQRITAYFLALGHYDAHIVRLRQTMKRRRAVLEQALAASTLRIEGAAASGGSSIWLSGPAGCDSADLADRLVADSVLIEPGAVFFETPPQPCPLFRLGYGSIDETRIPEGVALIERAANIV